MLGQAQGEAYPLLTLIRGLRIVGLAGLKTSHLMPADFLIDEQGRIAETWDGRDAGDRIPLGRVELFAVRGLVRRVHAWLAQATAARCRGLTHRHLPLVKRRRGSVPHHCGASPCRFKAAPQDGQPIDAMHTAVAAYPHYFTAPGWGTPHTH